MKSIFQSRTFWTNIVALGAMGASFYPPLAVLGSPEVQAAVVGMATGVANIGLRAITTEPVRLPGQ